MTQCQQSLVDVAASANGAITHACKLHRPFKAVNIPHLNFLSAVLALASSRCSSLIDRPWYFAKASAGRLPSSRIRFSRSPRRSCSAARRASSVSIALLSSCRWGFE